MAALYNLVQLHVRGTPYAARVNRIITAFETLYGSFLYRPAAADMTSSPVRRVADLTFFEEEAPDAWVPRPIKGRQTLILRSVYETGSFDMSFSGVGDAIEAAAEVCDPLRRKERKARLQHMQAMNRMEQVQASMGLDLKSLDLAQRQIDMIMGLIEQGIVEPPEGRQMIRKILAVQDSAGQRIEREHAEVIDVREEPRREIAG